MRIILRSDVDKLGRAGEVVEVADGYARNYLLARKLALPATPANEQCIAKEHKAQEAKRAAATTAARDLAAKLQGLSLTVQSKADGETLYAAVGVEQILAALATEHGIQLPAEAVRLAEPIKKVGTHEVRFRLSDEAEAVVKVWVLPDDGGRLGPAEPEGENK